MSIGCSALSILIRWSYTLGSFIHILLVVTLVVLLIRAI